MAAQDSSGGKGTGAQHEPQLEVFSSLLAEHDLDEALAKTRDVVAIQQLLVERTRAIPDAIARSMLRYRGRVATIERARQLKLDSSWRPIVQGAIEDAEARGGGSLPTFGGHAEFIEQLRKALQGSDSEQSFFTALEAERKRWKLSMFGRNKIAIIDGIIARIRTDKAKVAKSIQKQVAETLKPELDKAAQDHEHELSSLCHWYQQLQLRAFVASNQHGQALRVAVIRELDAALAPRLVRARQEGGSVEEWSRIWHALDQAPPASFAARTKLLTDQARGEARAVVALNDLYASEARHRQEWVESMAKMLAQAEELKPALKSALRNLILKNEQVTAAAKRQLVELLDSRHVRSISDYLKRLKMEGSGIDVPDRKEIFDAVAAMEPFRALRLKLRRMQHQLELIRHELDRTSRGG
jgi:hypothetical protein